MLTRHPSPLKKSPAFQETLEKLGQDYVLNRHKAESAQKALEALEALGQEGVLL